MNSIFPICTRCIYFELEDGTCRKNPPGVIPVQVPNPINPNDISFRIHIFWPKVESYSRPTWCGQFRPEGADLNECVTSRFYK